MNAYNKGFLEKTVVSCPKMMVEPPCVHRVITVDNLLDLQLRCDDSRTQSCPLQIPLNESVG